MDRQRQANRTAEKSAGYFSLIELLIMNTCQIYIYSKG